MSPQELYEALTEAIETENTQRLREIVQEHRRQVIDASRLAEFLALAAERNKLKSLETLVDLGADVNSQYMMSEPAYWAAFDGAYEAVEWLLDHGANLNRNKNGVPECRTLDAAAIAGHLNIVKLLVERGAAINGAHPEHNALSMAMTHGRTDVVEYLRSKGAKTPWELRGEPPPKPAREADSILGYVEHCLGPAEALSLQEVVAGSPPIAIHVFRSEEENVLVTEGMSSLPMAVPAGAEEFQFAELVLRLPVDWPLDPKSLGSPEHFWPVEWLRRIARWPHENHSWLGGKMFVFRNGEPPVPFASNTKLSCWLGIAGDLILDEYTRSDGTTVVFYALHPIYSEEANLEKRKGAVALIKLLDKHHIDRRINPHRQNVALK